MSDVTDVIHLSGYEINYESLIARVDSILVEVETRQIAAHFTDETYHTNLIQLINDKISYPIADESNFMSDVCWLIRFTNKL